MRLGVLSDSHNHLANLNLALELFRREDIGTIIHCGDLTSTEIAAQLAGFDTIYLVGNVDPSPAAIAERLAALNPRNTAGEVYHGALGGVAVAATHGHLPSRLDELVRSGQYAFVFHGHTHRRRDETHGRTRVINPGALGGVRYEARSACIVDLATGDLQFHVVAER